MAHLWRAEFGTIRTKKRRTPIYLEVYPKGGYNADDANNNLYDDQPNNNPLQLLAWIISRRWTAISVKCCEPYIVNFTGSRTIALATGYREAKTKTHSGQGDTYRGADVARPLGCSSWPGRLRWRQARKNGEQRKTKNKTKQRSQKAGGTRIARWH